MRTELQSLEGRRISVTGIFIRFDWYPTKWGFRRKVLLKNLKHSHGRTQHVSLSDPTDIRIFEGFGQGDVLQFSAIVHTYVKGYPGENPELKQTHPIGNDYGFHDVQEIICLSNGSYQKKEINAHRMQELNSRKRISLGVC
jgi:hypothetical protein